MKSVLEEASSVPKAIEKAWVSAGRPEEFTIKVFETEQRNFFGLLKKAAVVTILFDPRKTPQGAQEAREQSARPRRDRGGQQQRERRGRDGDKRGRDTREGGRERSAGPAKRADRPEQRPRQEQKPAPKEAQPTQAAAPADQPQQAVAKKAKESWTPELIDQMTGELKAVCGILEISEPSKVGARGSTLRIEFAEPVIEDVEYERMLFSSFAHLLFQFVKREHRSKLRGLRIALSSGREQEKQPQPEQQ